MHGFSMMLTVMVTVMLVRRRMVLTVVIGSVVIGMNGRTIIDGGHIVH